MEELNYPIAYAPMSIDYPDEDGNMIHIGYVPNMCYVVELKRIYNSDGTYKNRYQVVFVDKIVNLENKKIETDIPKYEIRYYDKCYVNAEYVDDIAFDYDDIKDVCIRKNENLYSIKTFTDDEQMRYLIKLNQHEELLRKTHSNKHNYGTLCYKLKINAERNVKI